MDGFERAGARLIPVAVDENGAVPEAMNAALRSGAAMVLLTLAAQNPTGASWSAERRVALAAVLAEHPNALVVEDDQFADVAVALAAGTDRHNLIYVRRHAPPQAPHVLMLSLSLHR